MIDKLPNDQVGSLVTLSQQCSAFHLDYLKAVVCKGKASPWLAYACQVSVENAIIIQRLSALVGSIVGMHMTNSHPFVLSDDGMVKGCVMVCAVG